MNTVRKGDELEAAIFEFFSTQIDHGQFWAHKDYCKIFTQKGYYSRDREKDIIFDVSIEIYLPGQETYSVLVLIECKNYNHRVPVDDIEEFYAKVQQVSGANIKGIVASTNAFQDGALRFSKSKGIGLLRYFEANNSEWVLTRSPSSIGRTVQATERASINLALQQEDFVGKGFDCYCFFGSSFTNSTFEFFEQVITSELSEELVESACSIRTAKPEPQTLVRYLDSSHIESKSELLLDSIGYFGGYVQDDKLSKFVSENYGLSLVLNAQLQEGVLGSIDFSKNEIKIDTTQCETKERARFTLAHELGHYILGHADYILRESCYDSHLDEARNDVSIRDIMRLEWQANQFASSLLLPKKQFVMAFLEQARTRGIHNRGFGALFVDDQFCNKELLNLVTLSLMKQFNVSKTVIIIRLKQLGIMHEPVGQT
ncbi:ImmA/IrrE family metallo-endopeptidase [Vibrio parahaemolyticus]|nr:ImmA/IrrE family metallo-endopeptidase [Vibrio parahaemolyticus]EHZ2493341.1 ImmA/IrrE family metallo-endopeptidase [Vibrio parahaemolyticus]EJB1765635.1 ImmA/IrrE family metallo-endopeptidase [Vibrio parahaemolyticus]EJG1019191.1 ImmA/IrrE family metallo-endopeptidase [Vibrio parahaemolyticus]ELA9583006.1 ImmA/IrrE family metallo-endopeptidase [Vibrio parahaemolyticus]